MLTTLVACGLVSAPAGPALAVNPDSTDASYHEDFASDPGWTVLQGTWTVENGVYKQTGTDLVQSKSLSNTTITNGRISFKARADLPASGYDFACFGAYVKYVDSDNYIAIRIGMYKNITLSAIENGLGVGDNGHWVHFKPTLGKDYNVVVTVDGDKVNLAIDGIGYGTKTACLGGVAGKVGFYTENPASYDNLDVNKNKVQAQAERASGVGGALWEDINLMEVPTVWNQLANERLMFPMEMADIAKKIGAERQLFLDNCLIASAENITRQVHQPRRYEGNPVLMADPRATPREIVRVLHVLQSDESPRFRMWYHSMLAFYEWKGDQRIRNGTSYAVSEDGIHWERPGLDLHHPLQIHANGGIEGRFPGRNVVMPYGMMDGLFYQPREADPNKRYKAIVHVSARKTRDGKMLKEPAIPSGWYLHWSPDGIHWQGDLSRSVIPAGKGFPVTGIGDTSLFWWDSLRKKYIGDVKWVVPMLQRRCRGIMESEDLIHWTRPRPMFYGREPDHQIYTHRGFPYQGMYIGFREIFDLHYMNDPLVHSAEVELDCSRDGKTWTRVGTGQPFMPMNPGRDTWDADEARPIKPLVVGDELWIYYASRLSPVVYTNMFKNKPNPRGHQQDIFSTALAKLRLDGFASLNAGDEPGTIVTRPLTFEGKKLYVNAEVAEGGYLKAELGKPSSFTAIGSAAGVRDRGPEDAIEPYTLGNCTPVTGDVLRAQVAWGDRKTIEHDAKKSLRLVFELKKAKLYSFWIR